MAKPSSKTSLIRQYAKELEKEGRPVTHRLIREMLDRERPGHKTYPTEIWLGLGKIGGRPGRERRVREGTRVEVDGTEFPSIRAAAEAYGKPMETIRKRLASNSKNFLGWRRIT